MHAVSLSFGFAHVCVCVGVYLLAACVAKSPLSATAAVLDYTCIMQI
jgi:hypothetical protein